MIEATGNADIGAIAAEGECTNVRHARCDGHRSRAGAATLDNNWIWSISNGERGRYERFRECGGHDHVVVSITSVAGRDAVRAS